MRENRFGCLRFKACEAGCLDLTGSRRCQAKAQGPGPISGDGNNTAV